MRLKLVNQSYKRRTLILDREWQLAVFRNMAGVALVAAVVQMLALYTISSLDPLQRWSGEQIGFAALAANVLFLVLVFVALWVVAIRITHSVVGPAMVIQRAVRGLTRGEYGNRLTLREKDYLTGLATAVKELSDELEARDELVRELTEALSSGDSGRALALAQRLERHEEPSLRGDASCAA